jgi:hypothetical protein
MAAPSSDPDAGSSSGCRPAVFPTLVASARPNFMTSPEFPSQESQSGRACVSTPEWCLIIAATGMIAAAVLNAEPLQSANDRSRWATVWSLVERRTFQIDEIDQFSQWSTIDKVRHRTSEDQPYHFYSSKPPLLSVLVAGVYAAERWTLGYGLFNHTAGVMRGLLLVVNVIPFFLALRSLAICLHLLGTAPGTRHFVLTAAGFATLLNPYLTTLNNHNPAAVCAMLAITAAVRILQTQSQLRGHDFAQLGFFAALTACFELPAALLGVLAFLLAVKSDVRRTASHFALAAAIPLAAFFITNWMATGGVKPFYASYGTDTYVYEHNGIPSYWSTPRDLDANTEPTHVYLFHCLLGHHGLLSLTPILFCALPGWWLCVRYRENPARRVIVLSGMLLTVVTLGFYLSRTENYNYGGNSVGLRWMLWLSPFWWLALSAALERYSGQLFRRTSAVLLLASIVSVNWSINRPWRPSWLYQVMEAQGWIQYRTPATPFDPPRRALFTKLPDQPGVSAGFLSSHGERLIVSTTLPSAAAGVAADPESKQTVMNIRIELEIRAEQRRQLRSDAATANPSSSASRFLLFPAAVPEQSSAGSITLPDSAFRASKLAAIFPMPAVTRPISQPQPEFRPAGITWVRSQNVPEKAYKVQRAAVRLLVVDPVFGKCWHRCDVLFCDELPFGVLQWKNTLTQDSTGDLITSTTWIAERF